MRKILTVGCDLQWGMKLGELARALGFASERVRSLEELRGKLAASDPVLVVLDGNSEQMPIQEAATRVLRHAATTDAAVIAFASHVEVERIRQLRALGIPQVVTRGQCMETVRGLLEQLGGALAPSASTRVAELGAGKFTTLVFGLIIVASLYSAYHIMPFYYYHYELQNHFDNMIDVASMEKDETIRKRLWYYIERYEINADPEDLEIERSGSTLTISLPYEEVFSVSFQGKEYVLRRFKFHCFTEGEF